MIQNFKRIVVGISGGVDSAVSALLLKRKGYEVIGAFMRNWNDADENIQCDIDKDLNDALYTCDKLQIPLKEVSFVKEYWSCVFQETINEYVNGLTPNPDILCNSRIKFNCFYQHCMEKLHADAMATGHYVRTSYGAFLENYNRSEPVRLLKGVDEKKDQAFFLSRVSQNALQRTMFPVGLLTKTEVKQIAVDNGLERIAQRKESMGICFVGKRNFQQFMSQYVPDRPGHFIDIDTGEVVGEHKGIHNYTIGQRSGIKESVTNYVAVKDPASGHIFVARGDDHPALFCRSLILSDDYWISGVPESFSQDKILKCKFRFLHRKPLLDCTLIRVADNCILLDTEEPMYSVPRGQFAVFYDRDQCLGSAKIIHSGPSDMFRQEDSSHTDEEYEAEAKPHR